MMDDIAGRIDRWLQRCTDPEHAPLQGMAEAGLLAPAECYGDIARMKAALVARTGIPGIAGVWAGPQIVGRYFIGGFGNEAQRKAWRGRPLAVAISEPKVGAHPKLLNTRAERSGDGYCINGEKAWVSNGPSADAFVVLAITGMDGERKRYSALLVPRDTAGVTLKEMAEFQALRPSRHCGLVLDNVQVPAAALLGAAGSAYEVMALPFRDLEDAVGTFTMLGAFRFLLRRFGNASAEPEGAALSLGALVALAAVYADGAEAVVAALDAGRLADKSASLVGLRVLAADWLRRARAHRAQFAPAGATDVAVDRLITDLDALLSVARGPRLARQKSLAAAADDPVVAR